MIAISDTLFSPIEPSNYGFITAKLKYIGNRIKHNTSSSREFVKAMKDDEHTIAMIPECEIFNKTTLNHHPLVLMNREKLTKPNQKIYDEVNDIFKNLANELSKKAAADKRSASNFLEHILEEYFNN